MKTYTKAALERAAAHYGLTPNQRLQVEELAEKAEASPGERAAMSRPDIDVRDPIRLAARLVASALVEADNDPTVVLSPEERAAREAQAGAEHEAKAAAWRVKDAAILDLRRKLTGAGDEHTVAQLRAELTKLEGA